MTASFDIALPDSWNWVPLKFSTTFLSRGTAPEYVDDGPVRAVSQAANRATGIDWSRTRFHAHVGDSRSLKGYLYSDDILINSTGTGTLGRIGYFAEGPDDRPCIADGHVTVTRADRNIIEPRFLFYWMSCAPYQDYIYSCLVTGATNQIELNRDQLAGTPVVVPPIHVQRRIVDLLDLETGRIDSLAAGQQRVLNLLEDRVDSRILEIVGGSRLVDPSGDAVQPAKRLLAKLARATKATGEVITAYRDGQVTSRSIRRSEGYTLAASTDPQGQGVEVGDVVVHGLDGFAGAIGDSEADGNCSPVYHVCAPADGGNPAFYGRLLRVLAVENYLGLFATSTRERAVDFRSWDLFGNIPIPQVEPLVQHEIGQMIASIRPLRKEVVRFNALLAERRLALITAAVTGQIDVTTARGGEYV
ncbi:type I restriction-modification system, S subunit [Rhodococcus erythropolis SK121]|nr:type I restriction-modification system, S subunit [Rhodococcus erythropolis SK121]